MRAGLVEAAKGVTFIRVEARNPLKAQFLDILDPSLGAMTTPAQVAATLVAQQLS